MTSTIRDLTELLTVAANDYLLISDTSDVTNRDKRISQVNLIGGALTGGGTLATGGFTLTVPATGTAALLATAQTFSALKTFSAGINLGQTTLSMFEEGTWTPVVADAPSGGNLATGTFTGNYIRVGNLITLWAVITDIVTTGMTPGNPLYIRGLPYAARAAVPNRVAGQIYLSRFTFTLYVVPTIFAGLSYIDLRQMQSGGTPETQLTVAAVASSGTTDFYITISYLA